MDIENELTNMLANKADGVDVNADLDSILDGTRVIRTSPSMPTSRTSPLLLVSAGIAASLLIGMLGLVLLRSGNETTPAPLVETLGTGYFPVFGELPDEITRAPSGSFAIPDPNNPTWLTAAVGQVQQNRWQSVSQVGVSLDKPRYERAEEPDWQRPVAEVLDLGDILVERFDNGEGSSSYLWEQNGLWVLVTTELSDPIPLLTSILVSAAEDGVLDLRFDELPTGFSVLAAPSTMRSVASPLVQAGVPPGISKLLGLQVLPGGFATVLGTGTYSIVDINGSFGLLKTEDNRTNLVWRLSENQTAGLGVIGFTSEEALAIARDVTFVDEATWREIYNIGGAPPVPPTTLGFEAPPTTTTTEPVTTTTTLPEPEQALEFAWTEIEAERHVTNFLAALAAGAYEEAAWSATDAGIIIEGQTNDELPAEAFERLCADGACSGPYSVRAEGPGIVDPKFSQASSMLTITHIASGAQKSIQIGTFEGQLIIAQLPPLVPSDGGPTLVEELFGNDIPSRVVVQRHYAFEIWEEGNTEWITHLYSRDVHQVEGDVAMIYDRGFDLRDHENQYEARCARLMTRSNEVLAVDQCNDSDWGLIEVVSGEPRTAPFLYGNTGDGESVWFTERGGVSIRATIDAEGNAFTMTNLEGVDLLGDDYASSMTLSTDGSLVAYTDHRDPAANSHWWSPVVVVKDTRTGTELGRWVLDNSVLCIEFAENWVIACETEGVPIDPIVEQIAIVAINVETGEINRVETPVRLFLPS